MIRIVSFPENQVVDPLDIDDKTNEDNEVFSGQYSHHDKLHKLHFQSLECIRGS